MPLGRDYAGVNLIEEHIRIEQSIDDAIGRRVEQEKVVSKIAVRARDQIEVFICARRHERTRGSRRRRVRPVDQPALTICAAAE